MDCALRRQTGKPGPRLPPELRMDITRLPCDLRLHAVATRMRSLPAAVSLSRRLQ